MKYTSLDLTVMMQEAIARRAELTAKLDYMESHSNEYYDMENRYNEETDEAEAEKLWTALMNWEKRENHLREALDSNRKLFDLLEAAQMELSLIEAIEREGQQRPSTYKERKIKMYTVKIKNETTFEILEAHFDTFVEARCAANIAYFAAGYNIEISLHGPDGEIKDW